MEPLIRNKKDNRYLEHKYYNINGTKEEECKMENRDVNLVIGTIAVYMDDVLPGIVEYELREYGNYQTLEWVRDQVEAWDKILYNREERDIVDFVNKYILAVHDIDIDVYWNMEEEDMRHDVVYRIYHECGKMLGMEINKNADKYLD